MHDAALFLCPQCRATRPVPPGPPEPRIRCLKCRMSSPLAGHRHNAATWTQQTDIRTLALLAAARGRAPTARQWRLLACGIARTEFDWLRNPWFRDAMTSAERWADTGEPPRDLQSCRRQLERLDKSELDTGRDRFGSEWSPSAEVLAQRRQERREPFGWVFLALRALDDDPQLRKDDLTTATRPVAAAVFRELFSNPFVLLDWRPEWCSSTVQSLAAHIYQARDFAQMPILADALQDAGCDDEQVLAHCRGVANHARGCWVLDAILGRA